MKNLYIDKVNLRMEFVSSSRGGLKGVDVFRESFSIAKSVKAYGLEDEIEHLKSVYGVKEVTFCELI